MRVFIFLILLFLTLLMLTSNSIAGIDLTPDMPAQEVFSATSQPQVIHIQENPAASQVGALVPVTGGCSDPYTVLSGDTLSQIAVNCNTTLALLKQVNPQIPNADCVYPGQQINIFNGSTVQQPAPCRVAETNIESEPQISAAPAVAALLEAPVPVVALPQDCSCFAALVPVSGSYPMIIPGTGLLVKALHFPANTPVNVAIGPSAVGYTVVASGVTDANGSLSAQITVPNAPDSQNSWVVVVLTNTATPIQVMSRPFFIGQ